ncbi:MAG: acyltransferase domain-containing protein [Pirellula sp.]
MVFTVSQRCADLGQRAVFAGTELAQPAIFLIQIGLAAVLKARGVEPADCIGHSLGSRTRPRETISHWVEDECPLGVRMSKRRTILWSANERLLYDALHRSNPGSVDSVHRFDVNRTLEIHSVERKVSQCGNGHGNPVR